MGAAQSQSVRKRPSVAHPASKTALQITALHVLNVMADFLGRLQRPNAGIGAAHGKAGLASLAPLADGGPKRDENGQDDCCAKCGPPAEPREKRTCKGDHGVRPVL